MKTFQPRQPELTPRQALNDYLDTLQSIIDDYRQLGVKYACPTLAADAHDYVSTGRLINAVGEAIDAIRVDYEACEICRQPWQYCGHGLPESASDDATPERAS